MDDRLRCKALESKVMSADEAAKLVHGKMNLVTSGFTMAGIDGVIAFQFGQALQTLADGCPVAAGQVRSAAGTCKQGVTGEHDIAA